MRIYKTFDINPRDHRYNHILYLLISHPILFIHRLSEVMIVLDQKRGRFELSIGGFPCIDTHWMFMDDGSTTAVGFQPLFKKAQNQTFPHDYMNDGRQRGKLMMKCLHTISRCGLKYLIGSPYKLFFRTIIRIACVYGWVCMYVTFFIYILRELGIDETIRYEMQMKYQIELV